MAPDYHQHPGYAHTRRRPGRLQCALWDEVAAYDGGFGDYDSPNVGRVCLRPALLHGRHQVGGAKGLNAFDAEPITFAASALRQDNRMDRMKG